MFSTHSQLQLLMCSLLSMEHSHPFASICSFSSSRCTPATLKIRPFWYMNNTSPSLKKESCYDINPKEMHFQVCEINPFKITIASRLICPKKMGGNECSLYLRLKDLFFPGSSFRGEYYDSRLAVVEHRQLLRRC